MSQEIAINDRIGSLLILEFLKEQDYNKKPYALCKCDCGNVTAIPLSNLRRQRKTKSCGCLQRPKAKQAKTTHGQFYTPTYKVWHNMIQRCTNPNIFQYKYYGGRGIIVCERWRSFENFLYDMGEKPENLTIERVNTNGNYEPQNCKWATMKEQVNNRNKRGYLDV